MHELIETLKAKLSNQSVLQGDDIGERYSQDWSGMHQQQPECVFRPGSTEEVSMIMQHCYEAGQKVVIQGGMTGMAGSAIPQSGEVAISLERLNGIDELDPDAMTMTVWAGTPLQTVQDAAKESGFLFPLDLGARGSCNIGGNVATNAGGTQVIRYGMMRQLILGLEVVLADGTVISSLNKMLKNNAGYDIKQLFIGAEGTLGIVTRVVLRLHPSLSSTCTAICAFNDFDSVIKFLRQANTQLAGSVSSYEVMWASFYQHIVDNVQGIRPSFDEQYPLYAIIETEGVNQEQDNERFELFLGQTLESGLIEDAVIAQSGKEAEQIWAVRHAIPELLPLLQPCSNMDVSIPISSMQAFLQQTESELKSVFDKMTMLVFGHIGDSNLHIMVTTGEAKDKKAIEEVVYKQTSQFQGSVSAEHGIGVLKKGYLDYSRTPEEIAVMQKIKAVLDPKNILNQSRIL